MAASDFISEVQHQQARTHEKMRRLRSTGAPGYYMGSAQFGYGFGGGWWGESTYTETDEQGGEGGDGGGDGGGGE